VVRSAALVLLVAVLALVTSGVVWVRATGTHGREGEPEAVLEELARRERPTADIDLGTRYAGRAELLDPRVALPRWHAHPRAQASAVFLATRDCASARPTIELSDLALAKAWAWHERTCTNGDLRELLERPPLVHPSGRSYAALAVARGGADVRGLHVVELASAPAAMLDADGRALGTVTLPEWEALSRGDRLVLGRNGLLVADHGSFGIARLRMFDRSAFETLARRSSLALVPREPHAFCALPASSALCWQPVTTAERHRGALAAATTTSAILVVLAAIGLALAYRRERQRAHADRLHILRTLTHELRTPATSLGIDIEPLRAAYDEIPASCQEPLLRIGDGIARLERVLHRTARYLELFERTTTLDARKVEVAAKEAFAEMKEEWPEGALLEGPDVDAKIFVDVEWLSVALRNLVENAVRHGKPPAIVSWWVEKGKLVVRVRDAGTSEGLSIRPHHRDPSSPGLGLGLAIVARVAELLGGTLEHEPSPTTFVLRVPS
jgi:signal transduction histidine kinase